MPDLSTIVKYAMSVGNKSGAIPPAPQGLLKLKESIEGLPFSLLTKGMSSILDAGQIMQGLQLLAQQMGGLQNLGGNFQQILAQLTSGTATLDQLIQAAGGVTAMSAALNNFLPPDALNVISSISPGTASQFSGVVDVVSIPSIPNTPGVLGSPPSNIVLIPGPPGPPGPPSPSLIIGGSNTTVIYNDSNTLGGYLGFTFNKTSNTLFVANTILIGNAAAVTNTQLAANLANYSNAATIAANYTNTVQLAANLSNYTSATQLAANLANYTNTAGLAPYVQNTDSRTLSGNLVFSGANVTFTGSQVTFTGNASIGNSILIGNTTVNTTQNSTGFFINGVSSTTGTVLYNAAQTLTANQQAQVRANIGTTKKNYIINGAMMVSQENGSTAGTTSGYYPVDQFRSEFVLTTGALSYAQVTSQTPAGSPNRIRITVTGVNSSPAAGDYANIFQVIEGSRFADFKMGTSGAKLFVLRFGVKAPAGTYSISFANGLNNRSYVAEYTIAAGEANTDVVKFVIVPGDIIGTWATDNTSGITIRFTIMCGTTNQQAAGSWIAALGIGSPNQFNLLSTNGNVFELFDVGLYEGSIAPSFMVPEYITELILSQRYFYSFGSNGITTANYFPILVYSTTTAVGTIRYPFMRVVPTLVFSAMSNFQIPSAGVIYTPSAVGITAPSRDSAEVDLTVSGMTAGFSGWFRNSNASGFINVNARM